MALHKLVFVIDVVDDARASTDTSDGQRRSLRRAVLHILLHFGVKYGFDKVRWGYTFLQMKTSPNGSFIPTGSDFKELRLKQFEDFELEFEAMLDVKDKSCSSYPTRSLSVKNVLKEVVPDFQWDQPDITSPTKLSLRPRSSVRTGCRITDVDPFHNGRNVVFVVSLCPTSWSQLMSCLSVEKQHYGDAYISQHRVSKNIQDMMIQKQVALNWVDGTSYLLVPTCTDNGGASQLVQVLDQVNGKVIPMPTLLTLWNPQQPQPRREAFAFCSNVEYLLSSKRLHHIAFPLNSCVLQFSHGNVPVRCAIDAEPLFCGESLLTKVVEVCLKGILLGWDPSSLVQTATESWLLHCTKGKNPAAVALQDLLMELSTQSLYMLAEVDNGGMVLPGVISPSSHCTALLTVLGPEFILHEQISITEFIPVIPGGVTTKLPKVAINAFRILFGNFDFSNTNGDYQKPHQIPQWADDEIKHSSGTTEGLGSWFPHSDRSGVTSNLMESMRLMHAVHGLRNVGSSFQQELTCDLAELYLAPENGDIERGTKPGSTHHPPGKQKIKSMSRALQMLNVARLNAKALKNQIEPKKPISKRKGPCKYERKNEPNKSRQKNVFSLTSEMYLLAHLQSSYKQIVTDVQTPLSTCVQQLLSDVKSFLVTNNVLKVSHLQLVKKHLLKSSKSIRQLYTAAEDVESKVRECKIQAWLRLHLCNPLFSAQDVSTDFDEVAEEVADILRIISLTKNPISLEKFLQDDLLPGFLISVPRILASVYDCLGTRLPEVLAAVLPANFYSDDSVSKDSISPAASAPVLSPKSSDCLQDLRQRSARKKRSGMLTRHRSTTESCHRMRQIEITEKGNSKVTVTLEKPIVEPQSQETGVTKVRRNLFNQESSSLPNITKLQGRRTVSAVDGLKRKRSHEVEDRLRTNKVYDTPLHKQVSCRLLYRQKSGRVSISNEECIVEESPIKPAEDVRRSPRIKKLARRHSSNFYPNSQLGSRSLDKALLCSQMDIHNRKASCVDVTTVRSPLRLLFGAADSSSCPIASEQCSPERLPSSDSIFSEEKRRHQCNKPVTEKHETSRKNILGEIYSCQVDLLRLSEDKNRMNPIANKDAQPFKKSDISSLSARPSTTPADDHSFSQLPIHGEMSSPSPIHQMVTRSGRTPRKGPQMKSLCMTVFGALNARTVSNAFPPTAELSIKRAGHDESIDSAKNSVSQYRTQPDTMSMNMNVSENSELHDLNCSKPSSTSDSNNTDIVRISTVKTWSNEDTKVNICFSEKPLRSGEEPSCCTSPKTAQGYKYQFRQTPDRQQREVAACVGYANEKPSLRFSSLSTIKPCQKKGVATQKKMSYKVEMEMQTSGLPKLKIKRTDSVDYCTMDVEKPHHRPSNIVDMKSTQTERQTCFCSKHRDLSCVSSSVCIVLTPAKTTPRKGRSVQSFICQSCTPTRRHVGTTSPTEYADVIPLSPSPNHVGKLTPDHLNSWPRKKRVQVGLLGGKDRYPKDEPLLEKLLEETDLGVSRLKELEDSFIGTDLSSVLSLKCNTPQKFCEKKNHQRSKECVRGAGVVSQALTPVSKKRKHLSAHGIIALTQSPLLYNGIRDTARKGNNDPLDEMVTKTEQCIGSNLSPMQLPDGRPHSRRTNIRKRLIQ